MRVLVDSLEIRAADARRPWRGFSMEMAGGSAFTGQPAH